MPKVIEEPTASPQERTERLALVVKDLDTVDPQFRLRLKLAQNLDLAAITFSSDQKERLLPFKCGLLTAAMVCDLIRIENKKAGDRPVGVYIQRNGRWVKLKETAILTWVDKETKQSILSPVVFPPDVSADDLEAPASTQPIKLGS